MQESTTALTRRAILALLLGGLLFLGYRVLHLFLVPVAWAVIFAYVTWPAYQRLRQYLDGHPVGSALLMTLILGAAFALPVLWLIALLREELLTAYQAITAYLAQGPPMLPEFIARIPLAWPGTAVVP